MQDCEGDDDNQDDSELLLVDDSDGDFNELAAETSSLGSSDSGGFVCSEDQRTFTAVRVRPMLPSEKKNGYRAVIDMTVTSDGLMTRIVNPTALPPPLRGHASARYTSSKLPFEEFTSTTDLTNFPAQFTQEFRSDYTYWSYDRSPGHQVATQSTIYDELGVLALQTVVQGNNCSIFAYGQPSAGKTYSMMGNSGERASLPASVRTNGNVSGVRIPSALSVSERRGLIPRICQDLFAEIDEGKSSGSSYTAIMSYVEIYDERVYDLLSQATVKKPLKVREHPEDGAFVERARRVHVTSYSQVLGLIEEGHRTRSASSSHSTRSVRSHTVLFISLAQSSPADSAPRKSKLCMVDLAGMQDFLFPDQPASAMLQRPSTTPSASLLELLASSSEFDRSGFCFDSNEEGNGCEHQLEELASPENWCSGDDEEVNLLTEFELTGMKEDSTILEDDSNVSPLLSLELCIGGNSMQSTLSLCVDSIDMARRALGPGVHNLRDNKGIAGGTGVECELLKYLDKKFIAMTRSLEDVMVTLQSCTQSPTCYELLESMVGKFCLQIIAKLCDQLPSAASACEAGRLQLETHLDQFSDRLRKLLPEVARDGDCMRSREANPAFVAATELLVMTERIKLVWNFAGHRKRERLLHMHALEAAAIKDRKMTAKIAALEERNVELSARCKTLVATSGRLKEPSSNDFDLAHLKHTSRIQIHSTVTLEQLEKECGAAAALKSGDNLGAKLAVEVARARDVQARNDDMLCRFATLNRALAAASARVTALEAENSRLNCGLIRSIDSENSSGNSVAAMEALNDRTTILQKELDYAHKYARELESQLASLKRVNVEQIAELKSVQALLSREKEARKRVDADLHQVKTQSDALVVDLKHQLADAQVQANELIAAEWAEHEKRWQSTNASLVEAQETNAELSIELFKVKADLRTALEEASQVEGESILHLVAIEELSASLKTQKETVEMCAEDAAAVQFAFKDFVSTQAAQISQLKRRICLDNQFQHELETKLAVAVQDRDEHILLLTQTEEALANALDREKMLRSQLEVSSAHDLEEINRVRAELHESTIEVASLREELTKLLDHSTLQSATIDNMKLEHAEVLEKCQQLELERDEQDLQYRVAATHIEAVHQEHAETAAEQLSRMERQLEGERQDCMATLETLQRQAHLFHKSQAQQHSIKMNYCSTIRDLKAQVKIETRMLSEAVKQAEEVQNQKEVLVQQHEQVALKLADQLQECRIDLNASTQRWIRAETRGVLLRISMEHLNRYLIESHEVCMMHLADVESSRLVKDRTTPESEQAVKEQLSSLDAWFDEVISSNQTTTEVQSANNNLAHDKELDKARDEDSAARSSLLKTLTDLSALTNELLIVCDATPDVNTRSNTQSIEWKSLTEHHNNGVGTRCLPQEVPTQKTSTCSEVAQLRKIVMKLKEALDAKDDILLFLDGKVKRLEQIASE
ncbi:hypothetical protein PF006_g247 [Phytophthora fragariae]|uniref:Kinesin motor domain-containing protein n=1 Tax=Phytophthora fragariae TaxID=53985 RepID=A0A6A3M2X5_9STRA|nr:hypothetical protein PF003_g9779 [Phytophthora fragariae]KAE9022744.1 hypothetical protein PF011_g4317 [Phytophthora fragariae]KAE9155824.1 hypothetical protein PF006_g247 [Phytophthora fragariae]